MARLKSRHNFPPGGWRFTQPETGWTLPDNHDFNGAVEAILLHRIANPRHQLSTNKERVEWELEMATISRLQSMKGTEGFILQGNTPGAPPTFVLPPSQKGGVAAGVKKVSAGIGVLLEWLGDGAEPVATGLAETRAKTCSECEFNKPGGLLSFFTEKASEGIRKQLEIRKDMLLVTQSDDKLNVCSICYCPLQLKVHVPIAHIERHTPETVKKQLPTHCWMLKEFTHK